MILSTTHESSYPFLPSCSLDLGTGNKLQRGVFLNAKLYPVCEDVPDYCYISYIGRSEERHDTCGILTIKGSDGQEICLVKFKLEPPSNSPYLLGIAYQDNSICGCVCATLDLLPVLKARYTPAATSFIFLPSTFTPHSQIRRPAKIVTTAGDRVAAITFKQDDRGIFQTLSGGTITIAAEGEDLSSMRRDGVVETIKVNVVILAGETITRGTIIGGTPTGVTLTGETITGGMLTGGTITGTTITGGIITGGTITPTPTIKVPSSGNIVIRPGKGSGLRIVPIDNGLQLGGYTDV